MISEAAITSPEQCRCTNDLALFPVVDSKSGGREVRGTPAPDFDERQAFSIEHDQVNLTASTTEISSDRAQAPILEIAERLLFGVVA